MCLAIPGKILSTEDNNGARVGQVQFGGIVRSARLDLVPEAAVGDYILGPRRGSPSAVSMKKKRSGPTKYCVRWERSKPNSLLLLKTTSQYEISRRISRPQDPRALSAEISRLDGVTLPIGRRRIQFLTVSTGQFAPTTTLCAVEPPTWVVDISRLAGGLTPITIRSAPLSSAVSRMTSAGDP
jgi:hypothetical protein